MKIGILGTRGIPNNYGGFEQFAEFFAVFAAQKKHDVYVYSPHNHTYNQPVFKNVLLIKCFDPEYKMGTAGQFIYDLNCILDSRKRNFDIILQLGYTSSSIWFSLHPKKAIVITNMDGLEWKRTKYSKIVQKALKIAERLAVKKSHFLIADSLGIQKYIQQKYQKESEYIAYGAHIFNNPNIQVLEKYQLQKEHYNMIMARFEPENNLDMVLEGASLSNNTIPIVVIGNHQTKYGTYLKEKYKNVVQIRFIGSLYNLEDLNNLRFFSNLYFHGHTVGGTNPSLLEAMASGALIAAHNNDFNKGVLQENAFYFSNANEVKKIMDTIKKNDNLPFVNNNYNVIAKSFNWEKINEDYLQFFQLCLDRNSSRK